MTTKKITYIATLYNSAGCELDYVSADDMKTLTRQLSKRLASPTNYEHWVLLEGDSIKITESR